MWAAIPVQTESGRREAEMVRAFDEIPRDAGRVIFFPRAAGGARSSVTVALCATAIVVIALLWEVMLPYFDARASAAAPARRRAPRRDPRRTTRAASAAPSSAPASS